MKKIFKIIIVLILLIVAYYIVSLILMNNNPYVLHYYKPYNNVEEAREQRCLINNNVRYKLEGFTKEQENAIRENIIIYTTKSYYEELYGFLIKFNHEDKGMQRVNIDLKNNNYSKIFDANIRYNNKYVGLIYGTSFDVLRSEKLITLDVYGFKNQKEIKIGEIEIMLSPDVINLK